MFQRGNDVNKDNRKWIVGIDEAGRGSLVGELMVAGYAIPQDEVSKLCDLGVRDSKELSRTARKELYYSLIKLSNVYAVVSIKPSEIDRENINVLTEMAAEKVLNIISKRVSGIKKIAAIYIDKFGRLRSLPLNLRMKGFEGILVVEEKADSKYKVVGAASIIAKHIRDLRIKVLSKLYGVKGSGYPSDPETVSWVKDLILKNKHLPIIRYSWSTLRDLGFGRKIRSKKTLLDFMTGDKTNG